MVDAFDPLESQLALASSFEMQEKWETAYQNYRDVAVKSQAKSVNESDQARKKKYVDLCQRAILQGQWCK